MEADIDFLEAKKGEYVAFDYNGVIKRFLRDNKGGLKVEVSQFAQAGDEQVVVEALDAFELKFYAQETEVFLDGKRKKMSDLLEYYGVLSAQD